MTAGRHSETQQGLQQANAIEYGLAIGKHWHCDRGSGVEWPQSTGSRWSCRTFLALLNNRLVGNASECSGKESTPAPPQPSRARCKSLQQTPLQRKRLRCCCRRRCEQAARGRIHAGFTVRLGVATPSLHWHAVRFAAESTPRYRRVFRGQFTQNVWAVLSWKTSFRMSQLMHSS